MPYKVVGKKMTDEQQAKEMLEAVNYLRKSPMKYLKENWLKLAIGALILERVIFYLYVNPQLNSFMAYVEQVIGAIK